MDIGYDIKTDKRKIIKSSEFNKILNEFVIKENINIYDIPSGAGCRRTISQKKYLLGFQYLTKLL